MLPPTIHKPLLILDKKGLISAAIISCLSKSGVIIVLTNATNLVKSKNVVVLPYGNRVLRIPDNKFSGMLIIDCDKTDVVHFSQSLIVKARESDCQLFFLNSVYTLTVSFIKAYARSISEASLLLYADVLSDERTYPNRAQQLLLEAAKKQQVTLVNSGVRVIYPIVDSDFVHELITLITTSVSPAISCFFPSTGITELTLARLLSSYVDLHIRFSKKTIKTPQLPLPSSCNFLFHADYPLKEKLKTLSFQKLKELEPVVLPRILPEKKDLRFWKVFFGGVLLFCLVFLSPFLFAYAGKYFLEQSINSFARGQTTQAVTLARVSTDSFSFARYISPPVLFGTSILGFTTLSQDIRNKLYVGEQGGNALAQVEQGIVSLQRGDVSEGFANIKFASILLSQLDVQGHLAFLPSAEQNTVHHGLALYSQLAQYLPTLLGYTFSQHYLILFLNSNELRPGGGFIGSYADAEISKGNLSQMTVHDVYDADGQLQGHVEPPAALRKYVDVQNWFLRDSNFSVEPQENADLENYFYTLETGQKVAGVMSVDTFFVTHLLQLTGPIDVADFKQTVTADNFFQLTEDHAEKNYFPGSTQKKTFLSAFNRALQLHMKEHPVSPIKLFTFLEQNIAEKHLAFSLTNKVMEIAAEQTVFGKDKQDLKKNGGEIDFFGINEANVGANKVNHYVSRSFQHDVQVDQNGGVTHTATVTYTNGSSSQTPYRGEYVAYVRAILPSNAALANISLDGEVQSIVPFDQTEQPQYKGKAFLSVSTTLPVSNETVEGKSVYGFAIHVPEQASKKVSITYSLPAIQDSSALSLFLYKQPGTDNDSVQLHVQTANPYILQTNDQRLTTSSTVAQGKIILNTNQEIKFNVTK